MKTCSQRSFECYWKDFWFDLVIWSLCRVRLRSDGAAIPRRRSGAETHSPTRGADTPPRAAACPSSPHKVSISKARIESPEKRRIGTFGSSGSINYPERKAYPEGHPLRPVPGATRHSSLGDHKSLETEALADVSVGKAEVMGKIIQTNRSIFWYNCYVSSNDMTCLVIIAYKRI